MIRKEWLDSERIHEESELGLAIKKKWADALGMNLSPSMHHIKPAKAIHTVLKAKEKEFFTSKILTDVFCFMDGQGLTPAGDIVGNLIAAVKEDGEKIRYWEIWIPII